MLGEQTATVMYGAYLDELSRAGATAALLSPGLPLHRGLLDEADGILLTGGGDVAPSLFDSPLRGTDVDSERDALEFELVSLARERRLPVLGMCRGNQVLNVALGGTLCQIEGHVQTEPMAKPVHSVVLSPGSRMAQVLGGEALEVNTYHRWAVDRPAPGMTVVGRADDGTAEAIEWAEGDWFAAGAQWHAELLDDPHVQALITGFVDAAREYRL